MQRKITNNPLRRTKLIVLFLGAMVILAFTFMRNEPGQAKEPTISPVSLKIYLNEVKSVGVRYHLSTFQPWGESFSLGVDGSTLTDGTISVPLASLQPVLRGLHTLYPGTRPVLIQRWTDDYPYAEVTIELQGNRYLLITSQSQFGRLIPWNVQVWEGNPNENGILKESYILLHEDFHRGLSKFWMGLTGHPFPRDYGPEEFWEYSDKADTVDFYVPENGDTFDSGASTTEITGAPLGVVEPFLPYLKHNPVIADLLESGYSVYDLAFDVTVTVEQMRPVGYSGTIALITPDGRDVIVTTTNIYLEPELIVETQLTKEDLEKLLDERRNFTFLQQVNRIFPDIVYLLDTREAVEPLRIDCPNDRDANHVSFSVKAFLTDHDNFPIIFYYLDRLETWSMDLRLDRGQAYWDDDVAKAVLKNWFPSNFRHLVASDLNILATNFEVAFLPGISQEPDELFTSIQSQLPPETEIHHAHPQKDGDMNFIRVEGRIVFGESDNLSQVIYCGHSRPSWRGLAYRTNLVEAPSDGERTDYRKATTEDAWTSGRGLLGGYRRVNWTTIGVSEPGFVHLLWTTDDGVYYADGWADGSDWSESQRLGDDSWNMDIAASASGSVHLLWSTDPIGSMHVWKNEQGHWQEPEYWEGIGYFSQAIVDKEGTLHLAYQGSDGLDREFFYQKWTEQDGLSEPENISRHLGDGGDGILQIDSNNTVHAAWGHPLSPSQYIDPLSGQIFDQVGVFYSYRLDESNWTLPEQIGTFAYFAYSMDFILTNRNEPIVAWQSDDGIVVRMFQGGQWTEPYLLAEAVPPETPAPFGPDRWGEITAEIRLGKDSVGNIYATWVTTTGGMYLAKYDGLIWSTPQQISEPGDIFSLNMVVAPDGNVHLVYFKNTNPDSYAAPIFHTLISKNNIQTTRLGASFTGYGLEENQLILDEAGYVYVLALPRTPSWFVYIPPDGIRPPQTPTPTITLTPTAGKTTATVTKKPSKTPTPFKDDIELESSPLANPIMETSKGVSSWIILLVILIFVGVGFLIIRMIATKMKKP